jgi:diamine N-acetyltransferase
LIKQTRLSAITNQVICKNSGYDCETACLKKEVVIRTAEVSDADNLTVLKQQVWIATYAVEGIRTEFSSYVLSEFTLDKLRETILDKNKILLVAEIDNHLVGCVEINLKCECPIPSSQGEPEIAVLYVLERYTGIGIGVQLLSEALAELKNKSFKTAWLTVYHENERALRFYKKNNFKKIGITYFEMGGNQYENKVMMVDIK